MSIASTQPGVGPRLCRRPGRWIVWAVDESGAPRHRRRERRRAGPDGAPRQAVPLAGPPPTWPPATWPPPAEPPPAEPTTAAAAETAPAAADGRREPAGLARPVARKAKRPRKGDAERGLRGIVGAGPSQVSGVSAMRARDAARPTAQDLAQAERDVVVVRRHYIPPDNLPSAR